MPAASGPELDAGLDFACGKHPYRQRRGNRPRQQRRPELLPAADPAGAGAQFSALRQAQVRTAAADLRPGQPERRRDLGALLLEHRAEPGCDVVSGSDVQARRRSGRRIPLPRTHVRRQAARQLHAFRYAARARPLGVCIDAQRQRCDRLCRPGLAGPEPEPESGQRRQLLARFHQVHRFADPAAAGQRRVCFLGPGQCLRDGTVPEVANAAGRRVADRAAL